MKLLRVLLVVGAFAATVLALRPVEACTVIGHCHPRPTPVLREWISPYPVMLPTSRR